MEQAAHEQMRQIEDTHWWFAARRAILRKVIASLKLPPQATLCEIGCGSGKNLTMLSEFGSVSGSETNPQALAFAQARQIGEVQSGRLPEQFPFTDKTFDGLFLFDVLEHIEQDEAALRVLHQHLNEKGVLMITVPAFSWLWSKHDELHHHFRRYTLPELKTLLEKTGYRITLGSYFNFWLFPLVAGVRFIQNLLGLDPEATMRVPPPFINKLFYTIFSSERFLLPALRLPFGVSILIIAVKKSP